LAGINFRIYYRPGTQNGKPDALSRRSEYRPEKGRIENQPITTVLGEKHFGELETKKTSSFIVSSARLTSLPARKWNPEFIRKVQEAAEKDPAYQQAKQEAVKEGFLELRDGVLYRKGLLWITGEVIDAVLKSEHDTKVAGHMGQD